MQRRVAPFIWVLALAALGACGRHDARTAPGASAASAAPLESASVGRGRAVYAASCAVCHGARGEGGQIGPPLRDERRRRTHEQIVAAIADPSPPMPKLEPAQISEQDLRDVAAFVEQL